MLFLDEPTTGLDPRNRNEVWSAIRALVAGGTTVLLTTQYLDEADQLADQVVVIDAGRVIADGTARASSRPRSAATVSTSWSTTSADLAAGRRDRRPGRRQREPERRRATPVGSARRWPDRVAGADRGRAALADAGIEVADIGLRRPTLDDVFLRLTGHRAEPDEPVRVEPSADGPRPRRRWRPMTATIATPTAIRADRPRPAAPGPLRDAWLIAQRDMAQWVREPQMIVWGLMFPISFVLLFAYVFGSGIVVPGGGSYREFLMPGMFAQTMAFGIGETLAAVQADAAKGVTDRFRSMPIGAVGRGRRAVHRQHGLLGGQPGDPRGGCGLAVGWRWHGTLAEAAGRVRPAAAAAHGVPVDRHLPRAQGQERRSRPTRSTDCSTR